MGRVIGIFRVPAANRADANAETVRFGTIDPPTLVQAKVDDRGPRIPKQRTGHTTGLTAAEQETAGLLLSIDATLTNPTVPAAIKDDMRAGLRRLAGDAVAADVLARSQQILDDTSLTRAEQVARILTAFQCPDWCDDCSTTEGNRFHGTKVGEVVDTLNEKFPVTVTVRVERTDDGDGTRGKAFVFVDTSSHELSPQGALKVAELYSTAARIALRDQAQAVAL